MRKHLLAILFIIIPGLCSAQYYDSLSTKSVKLDLLNFIDKYPSILLSFEHKLYKSLYLHHEGGIVIPGATNKDENAISGYKLREEIRMYHKGNAETDFYTSLDVRFNRMTINEDVILGYQCSDEWRSCQYYQWLKEDYKLNKWAVDLRIGIRHNLYPFFLEYDLGYGYGKDYIHTPNIETPEGYEIRSNDPFQNLLTDNWKVLISFRGKIGFYL